MYDGFLHPLARYLRGGVRSLLKRPAVSLVAVLSLALAIAGNSVVFSMVSAWLMHSWDYPEPESITFVWQSKPGEFLGQTPVSPANFADWRERAVSFESWTALRPAVLTRTGGAEPEPLAGLEVSANVFELLGGQPLHGQTFTAANEVPGRDKVVMLSYEFWSNRFGGDPAVVGTTLELGKEPYTVTGVLPSDFEFVFAPGDVFVPLALEPSGLPRARKELLVLARLRPGVTAEQAQLEMQTIARQLEQEYPEDNRGYGAKVLTLPEQFPGELNERMFTLLQGLLLLVLLIACINVANLLLAQGQRRQKEIALRSALGAGRRRIVTQLLVESLILGLAGGLIGLVAGYFGIQATVGAFGDLLPASLTPSMDWKVLVFTLVIAAGAGIVFGLTPALQASNPDLSQALGEGGRGDATSRRKRWLARGLVVAEMAGALVMLSGAALLVHSFLDLQRADPGFNQENLLTFQLNLPESSYGDDAQVTDLYDRLADRLGAVPGVSSAAFAGMLPRTPLPPSSGFSIDGRGDPEEQNLSATIITVSAGYGETLEVPLLRGRRLERQDREGSLPVTVINRAMAEQFWPEEDPIGARITVRGQSREVVGIVGDVQQNLLQDTGAGFAPIAYLPLGQSTSRVMAGMLRTTVPPETVVSQVREAMLELDHDLSPALVRTMEEHVEQFFVGMNLINKLLAVFGIIALLLAAVGIYGVIAFSVAQRTKEIGIRMAIGARRSQVLRQVTWEGLALALLGFAIGLPGVVLMILGLTSLLQGLSSVSPTTAIAVAVLLFLVALAASIVPARRAANLDPLKALQFD